MLLPDYQYLLGQYQFQLVVVALCQVLRLKKVTQDQIQFSQQSHQQVEV
tara:strand:- start:458 stop:604 length:147 start_codon:yes stop_codon:yes gene_type:complete